MSMHNKPVICLGCAFWDTIFKIDRIPVHGTKVLPEKVVQAASGMATAAAVTIARLGGKVELWARIGDDPAGDSFLLDISREDVGIGRIRRVAGARTAFSTILVESTGERLVVPYTDPALDADPDWLPLNEIAQASAVLVDMRWPEGARACPERGPSSRRADRCRCRHRTGPVLRDLISLADHVLFSEPALLSLTTAASPRERIAPDRIGARRGGHRRHARGTGRTGVAAGRRSECRCTISVDPRSRRRHPECRRCLAWGLCVTVS